MIKIKTSVTATDAAQIIKWAVQMARNMSTDFEMTDDQFFQAGIYCVSGEDSWEAGAAIEAGRKL